MAPEGAFEVRSELSLDDDSRKKRDSFVALLQSVRVPGWELKKITENFRFGVSIYGYFEYNGKSEKKVVPVKIRLSDHKGRWSGAGLDLRTPKDATAIENCLRSRLP